MNKMTKRDVLIWFIIVAVVLFVQRLTSSNGWGQDVWVAVIVASFAVGLSALRRNRRLGR
jgi:hypothetical protein